MRYAEPRAPRVLAVPPHALAEVALVDDAVDAPLRVLAGHVGGAAEAVAGVGDDAVDGAAGDALGVAGEIAVAALGQQVLKGGAGVVRAGLVRGDAVEVGVPLGAAACLWGKRDVS